MRQTVTTYVEGLPDLLTVREVAATLRLHEETIRSYIKAARLPALRLTPIDLRIRKEDLEAFLDAAAMVPRARLRRRMAGGTEARHLDAELIETKT